MDRLHHLLRQPRSGLLVLGLVLAGAASPAPAADPFLRRTATVDVVQRIGPAVVNITTERVVQRRSPFGSLLGRDPVFDQFFQRFFEPRQRSESVQSLGSGVLIDRNRHVITNAHVVNHAERIQVKLADGREFDAEAIGVDPNNDIAVLRVETDETLPWVDPGRSDDLLVGEPVIAIGNPFGLSNTVTTGVISATGRSIRSRDDRVFHGFLQTDASINPGNSGGPLLNAEGSLVGINTAIFNGAEGIGFAIPIDVAHRIVRELIDHGEVAPVWLGLGLQNLDERLAEAFSVPAGTEGVLVTRTWPGGPAARSGVVRGDLIVEVDGQEIPNKRAFYEVLDRVTGEQTVRVGLRRDGRERAVEAVAERLPDGRVDELTEQLLGMQIAAGEPGGFVVRSVRAGSAAARIGFRDGDRILGINGRALRDTDALRRVVLELRGREQALVVVQRGNGRYHVTLPLA